MTGRYIVKGQQVESALVDRSRRFRRLPAPTEGMLWEAVRGRKLAGLRFRRQQVIDGYVADFYCHAARLVVEVDGAVHDSQREHDAVRDQYIAANGLQALRVSNTDVIQHLPHTLERIAAACPQPPGGSSSHIQA